MTIESERRLADFFAATSERVDIIMLQGTGTKDHDGEGQNKRKMRIFPGPAVGVDGSITGCEQVLWCHDSLQF